VESRRPVARIVDASEVLGAPGFDRGHQAARNRRRLLYDRVRGMT
jgi:hypothetical protein